MKWVKPNSIEWKSYAILMPVIAACTCLVLFGRNWYTSASVWKYGFSYTMIVGLFMWYSDVSLTRYIHNSFVTYEETIRRVIALAIKQLVVITTSVTLSITTIKHFSPLVVELTIENTWVTWLVSLFVTGIAMLFWEGNYIFSQWKQSLMEKERYQQLSLQGEFDTLKSQVNPHFLFNCFNTLSSLITEDKEKAELFLDELSKVYRYLLHNNENGMSTLKSEVHFIRSYFQLLKTRHGDAVQWDIDIDKRYENYLLPSLSLQLLVENAVKHNALSKAYPLNIEIFTTVGNKLVVNNNMQKRLQKELSAKMGLNNIRSKYELLNQAGFQVMDDGRNFTAVLPLIWENVSSHRY